jgi:hypothetical protein
MIGIINGLLVEEPSFATFIDNLVFMSPISTLVKTGQRSLATAGKGRELVSAS